jgi:hypothetical protein
MSTPAERLLLSMSDEELRALATFAEHAITDVLRCRVDARLARVAQWGAVLEQYVVDSIDAMGADPGTEAR